MEGERTPRIENIAKVFDTKDAALGAVKSFWEAVHPDAFPDLQKEEYAGELTFGDKTFITRGLPFKPEENGKWVVGFIGNHQPLSKKATEYLKSLDKTDNLNKE